MTTSDRRGLNRNILRGVATFRILNEENDETPRDSYAVKGIIAADSPDTDHFVEAVEEIEEKHGLWGWCQVTVEARVGPLVGRAYLGGCSYEDEDDFKRGGYYEQMCDEAIDDIATQMREALSLAPSSMIADEFTARGVTPDDSTNGDQP